MQYVLPWLRTAESPFQLKCTFNNISKILKEPKSIKAVNNACKNDCKCGPSCDVEPLVPTEPRAESPDEPRPGSFLFVAK